jgi:hypothetical protein
MVHNNHGIIVSGQGRVESENIIIGDDTTISQFNLDSREDKKAIVAQAIQELLRALNEHSADIDNKEDVVEVVQKIDEEVKKQKPSKLTLEGLLSAIKNVVEPVTEVLQKVNLLKVAISTLFL